MKQTLHILALALGALLAPGQRATANAEAPASAADLAALTERLALLEADNAALRAANTAPAEQPSSELALLAKGAGVGLEDVTWRVRGGLSAKQAVDAAVAQKAYDATVADAAKSKAKK